MYKRHLQNALYIKNEDTFYIH